MDTSTYYAASMVGKQDDLDTKIIKQVWENDHSNMTAQESSDNCEAVYEAMGSEAYNKCYAAGTSCGSDSNCNALAKKYSAALVKGYSKDFESFKKRSSTLSSLGEIATGFLSGILSKKDTTMQNDYQNQGYYQPQEKSNKGLYIGIAVLAVLGIGTAIYFNSKK